MSYIEFDKLQLINLEYSLSKELYRSNRAGAFSGTTIIGCNTRKYHGLLIVRQPEIDGEHHVLLSTVDETVIQQDAAFNFGIHRFKGGYYQPKGHKYLRDYVTEPIPKLTFRVGGVFLTKEMLFTHDQDRVIIRYTLEDAHSPTLLRLKPFLAFRGRHAMSKENIYADTKYDSVANGIRMRLYERYSPLFIQFSKAGEYVHVPHWYYDIEYIEELERGYEYLEDLFVPGYFEMPLRKGESLYFSAGTAAIDPSDLKKMFEEEVSRRIPRNNFVNCLVNSAHQFIVRYDDRTQVVAGFPWFGSRLRDTFIALAGLTLFDGRAHHFRAAIGDVIARMKGPLLPAGDLSECYDCQDADTPLWLIRSLQQLATHEGRKTPFWKQYGPVIKSILEGYRTGEYPDFSMDGDGLISIHEKDRPLTWMDSTENGRPVVKRYGKVVEINALWYNALQFALELARASKDKDFVGKWESVARMVLETFRQVFYHQEKGYLADAFYDGRADWSFRPSQVLAVSLPYSPLPEEICKKVIDKLRTELLTPRGLRSLSPNDPRYIGIYQGDHQQREHAAHQGSVWPWLLGPYTEGYLRIYGTSGVQVMKKLFEGLDRSIREHGIGSVSEVYDGDPPHRFGGAPSMAWSVGEILRMKMLIDHYESQDE